MKMPTPEQINQEQREIAAFVDDTTNHTPTREGQETIERYRAAMQEQAKLLILTVPASRARSIALRHMEDAIMWGVKAIVLETS